MFQQNNFKFMMKIHQQHTIKYAYKLCSIKPGARGSESENLSVTNTKSKIANSSSISESKNGGNLVSMEIKHSSGTCND